MKKFIPLIILILGLLVFVAVFFVVRKRPAENTTPEDSEESVQEIAVEDRPVVTLTPTADGHYLVLAASGWKLDAATVDFELLYKLPDDRIQGVPGTLKVEGKNEIEEELLLGSESSGKFRYDEGVDGGTITLRFRNSDGKLIGKLSSEFKFYQGTEELASADGKFKFKMDKPDNNFYIVMETFGSFGKSASDIASGPYGVLSSSKNKISGEVTMDSEKIYYWNGEEWSQLMGKSSENIGFYFASNG